MIELTEPQQRLLDTTAEPSVVIDPRTNEAYVLVRLAEFHAIRELVEAEAAQAIIHRIAKRNALGRMDDAP
jgi:hypothetical protein